MIHLMDDYRSGPLGAHTVVTCRRCLSRFVGIATEVVGVVIVIVVVVVVIVVVIVVIILNPIRHGSCVDDDLSGQRAVHVRPKEAKVKHCRAHVSWQNAFFAATV